MINWQLSKQGIHWPVSPGIIAGSGVDPSRSSTFFEVIRRQVTSFQMIAGSTFNIHLKYVFVTMARWPRTIKILILNWPRTQKFSQLFKNTGGVRPFLTMVTPWSRSTSNFYPLIGQNLTGGFTRKIYASSWNLLTLTAEADGVLCKIVMFLTVFFHWMYKMKYSCFQKSSVIHGWFVYWVFGWETRRLSKSEIRFWIVSLIRFSPCWLV